MLRDINQSSHTTAMDRLAKIGDALEHEGTSRKHEAEVHNLAKEYAFMQRKKQITDADYETEKVLLATEFQGHLERRLRAAAYDAELNRKIPDPTYESPVERQMFCKDLRRDTVTAGQLFHTLPEGGYIAPVFTRTP